MAEPALITGFEPYGGRSLNPSAQLADALDGAHIDGLAVVGRKLPVAFAGLAERIDSVLDEVQPALVIALGLWPGEPMIRLERIGFNLANFEIADNAGARLEDAAIAPAGATALAASLPLRAIEQALLAAGIPTRLSNTAGTYLCNATLYTLLAAVERRGWRIPCGFIHLPYLPEQVAEMLIAARAGELELHQRADLASMDYAVMERALRLALAVTAGARAQRRGREPAATPR
jgi:pyroglutamyl-peptidase